MDPSGDMGGADRARPVPAGHAWPKATGRAPGAARRLDSRDASPESSGAEDPGRATLSGTTIPGAPSGETGSAWAPGRRWATRAGRAAKRRSAGAAGAGLGGCTEGSRPRPLASSALRPKRRIKSRSSWLAIGRPFHGRGALRHALQQAEERGHPPIMVGGEPALEEGLRRAGVGEDGIDGATELAQGHTL